MSSELVGWLLQGGTAGAVVYGLSIVVRAIAGRPLVTAKASVVKAEAADVLNETAVEWVKQAQAEVKAARDDAQAARRDADEARRDANEARREASEARREAEAAAREFRTLKTAILSPYATLEGLRALVSDSPGNGVAPKVPVQP